MNFLFVHLAYPAVPLAGSKPLLHASAIRLLYQLYQILLCWWIAMTTVRPPLFHLCGCWTTFDLTDLEDASPTSLT